MAKAKTTKKATLPLKDRAVRAALDLAASQGWTNTSMQDIAKRCQCKLSALNEIFEDRADVLAVYGRQLDQAVLSHTSVDEDSSERDRLFDVMMERFDFLNKDRAAIISILKSFCADPKQAIIAMPSLGRSMIWMLEAAGINANGPRGAMTAFGLTGVYLYSLKEWIEDDSPDMGKTMAALDKALGRAENLTDLVSRFIPSSPSQQ